MQTESKDRPQGQPVAIYLDSSVVARVLLGEAATLDRWGEWTSAFSSELLRIEVRRTLQRAADAQRLDAEELKAYDEAFSTLLRRVILADIDEPVIERASGWFPCHIRSLDAIHLATADLLRSRLDHPNLVFATHDRQQAVCAIAMGFTVVGAETDPRTPLPQA